MKPEFIKKNKLTTATLKNGKLSKSLVNCYIDNDDNVYKIEEDEEVGDILGKYKDGIFSNVNINDILRVMSSGLNIFNIFSCSNRYRYNKGFL